MSRNRAAYMRDYRARRANERGVTERPTPRELDDWEQRAAESVVRLSNRVVELEAEVARLKRELAARPAFNSRPFTPVPKR